MHDRLWTPWAGGTHRFWSWFATPRLLPGPGWTTDPWLMGATLSGRCNQDCGTDVFISHTHVSIIRFNSLADSQMSWHEAVSLCKPRQASDSLSFCQLLAFDKMSWFRAWIILICSEQWVLIEIASSESCSQALLCFLVITSPKEMTWMKHRANELPGQGPT